MHKSTLIHRHTRSGNKAWPIASTATARGVYKAATTTAAPHEWAFSPEGSKCKKQQRRERLARVADQSFIRVWWGFFFFFISWMSSFSPPAYYVEPQPDTLFYSNEEGMTYSTPHKKPRSPVLLPERHRTVLHDAVLNLLLYSLFQEEMHQREIQLVFQTEKQFFKI